MRDRSLTLRWLAGWPLDLAFGAVLTALNAVTMARCCLPAGGRGVLVIVLIVAETLPVAARRWRPLGALAVVSAAALLAVAAGLPASPANFAAVLVGLYTVASEYGLRTSVPAAAVVAAGSIVVVHDQGPISTGFDLALVACLWALGNGQRTVRALTAARLEQERSRQEAQREEALRTAADERARLARDVHDVVAHSLSVIVVQAGAGRRVLESAPEEAREALASIERTGREALSEIRQLLGVLRAGEPEADGAGQRLPQPGLADLDQLVARSRASGLTVEAEFDDPPADVSATVGTSAYRIVQEALTNCLRHAPGAPVRVSVRRAHDGLAIAVENGPARSGRVAPAAGGGHGLPGMKQRAALCRGELDAGPTPTGLWRVRATLPVEVPE